MKRLLNPLLYDKLIGILILFNVFVIMYLSFDDPPFFRVFEYVDYALTLIFLCEITYKISFYKKDFFKDVFNWFDASIVLISSISLVLLMLLEPSDLLGQVIILRAFRLFKLFRSMRIIPNAGKILSDLKKAVKVTYGIIIGGLLILLITGIVLCSFFKEIDPENFGDPLVSIYSVFRLFTVEGWYEIPDAICERTSYRYANAIRTFFSFIVLFGMFLFGFLISSISDELAEDNNDKLLAKTKELEDKIDKLSEKLDFLKK